MGNENPKTVGEIIEAYAEDVKRRVQNPESFLAHTKALRAYFGDIPLADVIGTSGTLRDLCRKFAWEQSGLANATIRKRLSILQSAFTLAWKRQLIPGKPLMWMPAAEAPKEREISADEFDAILRAADSYPTEDHVRTFVYLTLFTGLLRSQILSMKWDQVRMTQGVINVVNRKGEREKLSIHAKLRDVLERAYEARTCDHVIEWRGNPVKNNYIGVKALLSRAGLGNLSALDLRFAGDTEVKADDDDAEREYIFISYCRSGGLEYATSLYDELVKRGHNCWLDKHDMKAGTFAGQLTRAVKDASAVILILTPFANDSPHVLSEIARAHTARIPILPISVDQTTLGEDLDHYLHSAHRIEWTGKASTTAAAAVDALGI